MDHIPGGGGIRSRVPPADEENTVSQQHQPWTVELGEHDEKMGIEVLEQSAGKVVARIPIAGNRQFRGVLHGGAIIALGEAVAGWGALIHASSFGMGAVGVDINATHHRTGLSGFATATATAIKLGRMLASYEVVANDDGERLSTIRVTNAIIGMST